MKMYAVIKVTSLAADVNLTQTEIELASGTDLPTLDPGQYLVVLVNNRFKTEIMHCTDIDGTTLTVERGQKDGKIYTFSSGDYVQIGIDPNGYDINTSGSGSVSSVNGQTGDVILTADDIIPGITASGDELNILDGATLTTAELNYVDGVTSSIQTQLNGKANSLGSDDNYVTDNEKIKLSNLSGINTGDQTSITGISGTKAEFDAACVDGNFIYTGDITQYTDEMAQDAIGAMVDSSLVYFDGTPLLQRAALTGDITANTGSNSTVIATPSSATVATDDKVLIKDTSASDATKYVNALSIRDLSPTAGTTGSGKEVRENAPTLIDPVLGSANATSIDFGQDPLSYFKNVTSFSPTITFATPGDLSVVYTAQDGKYVRIGDQVFVYAQIAFTPTYTPASGASGAFRIQTLPFTVASSSPYLGVIWFATSVTYPAGRTQAACFAVNSATYISIIGFGSGTTQSVFTTSQFPTGVACTLNINLSYLV
jgi:hypothetical protein